MGDMQQLGVCKKNKKKIATSLKHYFQTFLGKGDVARRRCRAFVTTEKSYHTLIPSSLAPKTWVPF